MAVSKKRKHKPKKKKTQKYIKPNSFNEEVSLMNLKVFSFPKNELLEAYKIYSEHHKSPLHKEIDLKMNFISMTLKIAFNHPEPDRELFGYLREESVRPNCYINVIKYVHDENIALITEVNYLNNDPKKINIDPLKSFVYLADLLDLNLGFPAYINKDPQEKLFKSLGFEESLLKADEGQKILLRKAQK